MINIKISLEKSYKIKSQIIKRDVNPTLGTLKSLVTLFLIIMESPSQPKGILTKN